MNAFDKVAVPFENATSSLIAYHIVRHAGLESYYSAVGNLRLLVGTEELDGQWTEAYRQLRYFRYEPSLAPLPLNHPLHRSRIDLAYLQSVVAQSRFTYPQLSDTADSCLNTLKVIVGSAENPVHDEMAPLIEGFGREDSLAVVVSQSRFVLPVKMFYEESGLGWVDVIDPNALRREQCWDRLLYVGPVSQRFLDLDFVFSAPRAHEIHVLGFPWHSGKWEPSKAFMGGWSGKSGQKERVAKQDNNDSPALPPVNLDEIEEYLLETRAQVGGNLDVSKARVDARLYGIFGGFGVLLEASERNASLVIDLDASEEDRVSQISDAEIEEGMYIVLRTDSEAGYLVPIANQLIGAAAPSYRALQVKWKLALQELLNREGSKGLTTHLREQGSLRANYQNIRNWISPGSIAPEAEVDFRAISVACSMEKDFPLMQRAVKEIRNAHIHAGQQVRRQLRELVSTADPEVIERNGTHEFALPSLPGAKLTAFRIERKWDRIQQVSAASIERPFELTRN